MSATGGNPLWFSIRPFFARCHAEVPIQLTRNDRLHAAAPTALEVTMEATSRAEEEEHKHTAEIRSTEANREEPARTGHQPVLPVFVPPFFCLSLSSLLPLLLRRLRPSNNAQGSLYSRSWQPSRCPASLQAFSTLNPFNSCRSKMIPARYTWKRTR